MTAIAGLWSFDASSNVAAHCEAMLRALSIYGPDHSAQYSNGQVAMGRCLLGLLPEDRFDRQPLSAAGITAMVADLRLDNREELADKLDIPLEQAAITADSGILLAAWQKWREHCVDHLTGAFSFAVWNKRNQELFLARDQIGERPLFYSSSGSFFAFASMPKGLHALPFIGAEVDEDYVAHLGALVIPPAEQTIFRRILRLPAGCALSIRPEKTRLQRYWDPEQLIPLPRKRDEDYLEQLRDCFDAAVRARLRTTGKVGSQLSGGLDSSSVAATAARLLGGEGGDLTAYTAVPCAGFHDNIGPHRFGDEGPAAAEVAALYPNMRHVRVYSSETNFFGAVKHSSWLYDSPAGAPLNHVWANATMKQAQESGITVLLGGKFGNATFSEYGLTNLWEWFRKGQWLTLARIAWQIKREGDASLKSVARNALWPSLPFWLRRVTDPHLRGFSIDFSPIHPDILQGLDLHRRALRDVNTVLPGGMSLLRSNLKFPDNADVAIAAQGGWKLDYRDPTMDRRVVEFCLTVPLEQFVRGGKLRSLARRAMAGRLPETTLNRMHRGLQSADWYESLTRIRPQMLAELDTLERSPLASRTLDLAHMRRMLVNWPTFESAREQEDSYHFKLTAGFSIGCFLRKYDREA